MSPAVSTSFVPGLTDDTHGIVDRPNGEKPHGPARRQLSRVMRAAARQPDHQRASASPLMIRLRRGKLASGVPRVRGAPRARLAPAALRRVIDIQPGTADGDGGSGRERAGDLPHRYQPRAARDRRPLRARCREVVAFPRRSASVARTDHASCGIVSTRIAAYNSRAERREWAERGRGAPRQRGGFECSSQRRSAAIAPEGVCSHPPCSRRRQRAASGDGYAREPDAAAGRMACMRCGQVKASVSRGTRASCAD
jgi:hypothetical protein